MLEGIHPDLVLARGIGDGASLKTGNRAGGRELELEGAVVVDEEALAESVAREGLDTRGVADVALAHAVSRGVELLGRVGGVEGERVVAEDKGRVVVRLGAARGALVLQADEQAAVGGLQEFAVEVGAWGNGEEP